MDKVRIFLFLTICSLCLLLGTMLHENEVFATESTEVETSTEETTEESSLSDANEQILNNMTQNGVFSYWSSGSEEISNKLKAEGGLLYRCIMKLSLFFQQWGFAISIFSIIVGVFLKLVSGMYKPLRRAGIVLMTVVPILVITMAFAVPIGADLFFYGK